MKKTGKAIDSDHYIEFLDLNLEFTKEKPQREEIFNFKVNKSQEAFKILTTETKEQGKNNERISIL